MRCLRETKEGWLLTVPVIPRSSLDGIVGIHADAIKIRLKASPVDGKANDRLIRFFAGRLEVPPSHIQIIRGHTARDKQLLVTDVCAQELGTRLGLITPS